MKDKIDMLINDHLAVYHIYPGIIILTYNDAINLTNEVNCIINDFGIIEKYQGVPVMVTYKNTEPAVY